MKYIVLTCLMFIASIVSVISSASPAAHAAAVCEYRLTVIIAACSGEGCMCDPVIARGAPTDPDTCDVMLDGAILPELRDCCRACDGTILYNPLGGR